MYLVDAGYISNGDGNRYAMRTAGATGFIARASHNRSTGTLFLDGHSGMRTGEELYDLQCDEGKNYRGAEAGFMFLTGVGSYESFGI